MERHAVAVGIVVALGFIATPQVAPRPRTLIRR
jgi:hypothetical protein